MNAQEILSVVSGLLMVLGFIVYGHSVWRDRKIPPWTPGKTEPSKASWLIWLSLDSIAFFGMVAKHTINGQIIGTVLGGWAVLGLALKYGTPGLKRLDKLCLGGAVLGILLWILFEDAIYGIIISQTVALLGSIPTFVSAWRDPSAENRTAWTFFWVSCLCQIVALKQWTLANAAQPVSFTVIETIMMYILYIHAPRRPRNPR